MKNPSLRALARRAFAHPFLATFALCLSFCSVQSARAAVTIYPSPPSLSGMPISYASDYQVKADNQNVAVFDADPTDLYQAKDAAIAGWNPGVFATFEFSGSVQISVTVPGVSSITSVNVLPKRLGITPTISGKTLTFTLNSPANFGIDVNGNIGRPLWIFANGPEGAKPSKTDPNVRYFSAGQTYNAGEIFLNDYSTVYIEGGAVVNGKILWGNSGPGPKKILGRGILCGNNGGRLNVGANSGMTISGPVIIGSHPDDWTFIISAADNVLVDNVKVIGVIRDGLNPLGCQSTTIQNSFLYSYDDALAIKAWQYSEPELCDGITVKDCVFWNHGPVIGFETRTPQVKNITFRNLDIVRPRSNIPAASNTEAYNQRVAPMKVDVSDRATVSGVLFENIRIYNPVGVDFFSARIHQSFASTDTTRGQIDGVTLKDISVTDAPSDWPGRTVLKGHSAAHTVKNISFQNISINGVTAQNAADINLMRYNWADSPTISGLPLRAGGPNFVMNHSFENPDEGAGDGANWQESTDNGASLSASYVERRSEGQDGNYLLTHYSSSAFKAHTFQGLSGLPNGSYTLKALAKKGGGTSKMFAEGFGGSRLETNVPTSSNFQTVTIAGINVSNGTMRIGFQSDLPNGGAAKFDKVELTRNASITLKGATNGATYSVPRTFYLGATISGVDLVNLRVDYFANGVKIGQGTVPSDYWMGWNASQSGTVALTCKAINIYSGATVLTSAPVNVTLQNGGG